MFITKPPNNSSAISAVFTHLNTCHFHILSFMLPHLHFHQEEHKHNFLVWNIMEFSIFMNIDYSNENSFCLCDFLCTLMYSWNSLFLYMRQTVQYILFLLIFLGCKLVHLGSWSLFLNNSDILAKTINWKFWKNETEFLRKCL